MMPVAPTAKRSNGFSIDSLMGKDPPRSRSPSASSPGKTSPVSETTSMPDRETREPRIGGAGSSFHPVHPGAGALLNGLKGLYQHAHRLEGPHTRLPECLPPQMGLALPFSSPGGPPGLPGIPGLAHHPGLPHHPMFLGPQRDAFALYPWLLSRQGSVFGHPRLGGPEAGLLYQPFRKPKRIRTAFSPSQLLRLEHAFEKNHYVVGQERKDLAANLSLTETQVKVWFQNRRTKYKRIQAEDGELGAEPRDKDHNDSRDSDIDMGDNEESPCVSPKPESYENGHNTEDDDIEVEASDSEEDFLHHQTVMAAQLRLYQSAAEAAVKHEQEMKLVGPPSTLEIVGSSPNPNHIQSA